MGVVGFHFTKMLAEKKKAVTGKVNISNNIKVVDVKEAKLSFGKTKQKGLEFTFSFTSVYEPEMGNIEITGYVVYMEGEEKVNAVLSSWKDNKKVPPDVLADIYNYVLSKCNIQALILSRDMQLPPPIPLPKVQKEK